MESIVVIEVEKFGNNLPRISVYDIGLSYCVEVKH